VIDAVKSKLHFQCIPMRVLICAALCSKSTKPQEPRRWRLHNRSL
jgi:hypothetical protein